jgi:hypothetical protein
MAATYELIASNTLTTTAASITFSSIPATYTDLVLRVSARTDRAGTNQEMRLRFNGSSSADYSNTLLQGNAGAASSERQSSQVYIARIRQVTSTDATANTFGSIEIYIPSYLSNTNKPLSSFGADENNTENDPFVGVNAGLWSDTSAINQIDLILPADDFISGSSFFLYGIKNS